MEEHIVRGEFQLECKSDDFRSRKEERGMSTLSDDLIAWPAPFLFSSFLFFSSLVLILGTL